MSTDTGNKKNHRCYFTNCSIQAEFVTLNVLCKVENSKMVTNSKYDSYCCSQPGIYKSLLNTRAVAGDKVDTVHVA